MTKRPLTRARRLRLRLWAFVYAGIVAVVAVVAGIVWNRIVHLPSYVIGPDFRANLSESALSQMAAIDAWFALIGLVGGLIVGVTAWVLFRRVGWPVTLIAGLGAGLGAVVARLIGQFIGPRNFEQRIALATRGDSVLIDFTAHTWVPLATWVGLAMVPVLIGSLLGRSPWISHQPQAETPGMATEGK